MLLTIEESFSCLLTIVRFPGSYMKTAPLQTTKKSAVSCHNCSLSELCLPRGLNKEELESLENAINKIKKQLDK